jgi:hypothetical protein
MIPELVASQAQGIIMGEAPRFRLSCSRQFGTAFLLSRHFVLGILYSIHILMSNHGVEIIYYHNPPYLLPLEGQCHGNKELNWLIFRFFISQVEACPYHEL